MKVNIHEFMERFQKEYDFCYEHRDRVAGFGEAVRAFDYFLKNDIGGFKDFVREFCEYRKDVVSSDREAAAFMFSLEGMGEIYGG